MKNKLSDLIYPYSAILYSIRKRQYAHADETFDYVRGSLDEWISELKELFVNVRVDYWWTRKLSELPINFENHTQALELFFVFATSSTVGLSINGVESKNAESETNGQTCKINEELRFNIPESVFASILLFVNQDMEPARRKVDCFRQGTRSPQERYWEQNLLILGGSRSQAESLLLWL